MTPFQTLWDLLEHAADQRVPLRIHGEPATGWVDIRQRARAFAGQLIADGCPEGARIVIAAHTSADFFAGFFGSIAAGALAVPTAPDVGRRALTQIPERLEQLDKHLQPWGWFGFADPPADDRRWLTLPEPNREPAALRLSKPDETAYLQLTSGTTTGSRATMVGHRQALANMATTGRGISLSADDRLETWLPLYHDYGLAGGVLTTIYHSVPLVLHRPAHVVTDPTGWLAEIAQDRISVIHSASFLLGHLMRRADPVRLAQLDLSHLRMFIHGGERLDATAFRHVQALLSEKTGLPAHAVVGGYGLAEATFCVSTGRNGLPRPIDTVAAEPFETEGRVVPDPAGTYRFVSVGPVLDAIEARIMAADGTVAPERRIGEIQVRGDSITAGYWRDPAATADLFQDGWLKTGDLGYLADGHLYVTGRIKEIIIQAGRNYLPQDIEELVETLPSVRRGGTVALGIYDHDLMTETLVLLVEADAQNLAPDLTARIQAAVQGQFGLTARRIILLQTGSIPKTTSGKRQRTLCRQWLLNDRIPESLVLST